MANRFSSLFMILTLICIGIVVALHIEISKRAGEYIERPVEWEKELLQVSNGLLLPNSTACGIGLQPKDDASVRAWAAVKTCVEREASLGRAHWAVFQVVEGIDTHGWRIKLGTNNGKSCTTYFENYSPSNAEIRASLQHVEWRCSK